MRFGFGLITCQRYPGDKRSDLDLYREALTLAEEAERLGFDSVWVSEHHFLDDAYMPSLLPFCAAIAARTERVAIGTSVLLAPLYQPLRLAEDAATVDLLSGGRLILGLGQGWRTEEFDALGVSRRRLGRVLEDTVATLRQAWSDGLVTRGLVESSPGVSVTPKPARKGGPPIWIGAHSEPAVRRAGRIADGYVASRVSAESFGERLQMIREELVRAGRDPGAFTFGLHAPTFAWPGHDAWALVRPYLHYVRWKYEDMTGARGRAGPPGAAPPLTSEGEAALRGSALVGPPEDVADQVARYRDIADHDVHFIARLYWPGMDFGLQQEALAVFAQEVIPKLR